MQEMFASRNRIPITFSEATEFLGSSPSATDFSGPVHHFARRWRPAEKNTGPKRRDSNAETAKNGQTSGGNARYRSLHARYGSLLDLDLYLSFAKVKPRAADFNNGPM